MSELKIEDYILPKTRECSPVTTTYIPPEQTYKDKVTFIILSVEKYYNLRSGTIFKYGRTKTTAEARKVAIWLAKEHSSLSVRELADEFNRDVKIIKDAHRNVSTKYNNRHLKEVAIYLSELLQLV